MNICVSSYDENQLKGITRIIKKKYINSYDYDSFLNTIIESFKSYEIIQKLSPYKKSKDSDVNFCIICKTFITKNQCFRTTQCNHVFHKKCLDKMIINYNFSSCPHCLKSFN